MARNPSVDMRTFLGKVVEAHRKGHNQSWIAAELGVSPAAVSLRIKGLRDKGVKVPELASGRSANTAEDANNILADLGFDAE
jgi:biotin operon repressor